MRLFINLTNSLNFLSESGHFSAEPFSNYRNSLTIYELLILVETTKKVVLFDFLMYHSSLLLVDSSISFFNSSDKAGSSSKFQLRNPVFTWTNSVFHPEGRGLPGCRIDVCSMLWFSKYSPDSIV